MSSALELRAPFGRSGDGIREIAARSRSCEGIQTKVFLKQYALRYLPENIVLRRKRGLSVPISAWLRGPLHDLAEVTLGNGHLAQAGIRTGAVQDLFSEHISGQADHAARFGPCLVLSEWLDWVASETGAISTAASQP